MEHNTNTQATETLTDDEILDAARETTRRVGATAERAVLMLDKSGVVMSPDEVADVRARQHQDIH